MKYGRELIEQLERDIATHQRCMADRQRRIDEWQTDEDDCFISERCDQRGIEVARDKIKLIENGGTEWFVEYATLDGQLINAKWCNTRYGSKLRAEMPNGEVVWTSSFTEKGLAKRGIKLVDCRRPAWYAFKSPYGGMLGVYSGSYELFPSDFNYATGEAAADEPLEIREHDWKKDYSSH